MKKLYPLIIAFILFSCNSTEKDQLVLIETSMGDMLVLLYDETPKHKANFLELASSGEYDNTTFHRVVKNYIIQGGDVFKKNGTVEPEPGSIDAEINTNLMHQTGSLCAVRLSDLKNPEKKSSASQFFIVQGKVWTEGELTTDLVRLNVHLTELINSGSHDSLKQVFDSLRSKGDRGAAHHLAISLRDWVAEQKGEELSVEYDKDRLDVYTTIGGAPHLDGEYTIFGRVVEGLDVIEKISAVKTLPNEQPIRNITMKMSIKEMKKSEVTAKYGYVYEFLNSK